VCDVRGRRAHSTTTTAAVPMASQLPQGVGAAELVAASCAALGQCSKDTPMLTPEDVDAKMSAVPLWVLNDAKTTITRSFTAKNWQAAIDFINGMSKIAEEEGHHPDLRLHNYRDLEVVVTTHAIGGLSIYDFILAAKLDQIEVVYSPKWLKENVVPAA